MTPGRAQTILKLSAVENEKKKKKKKSEFSVTQLLFIMDL